MTADPVEEVGLRPREVSARDAIRSPPRNSKAPGARRQFAPSPAASGSSVWDLGLDGRVGREGLGGGQEDAAQQDQLIAGLQGAGLGADGVEDHLLPPLDADE